MKRFTINTWRRLTIARVRWPKDLNDWVDVLVVVLALTAVGNAVSRCSTDGFATKLLLAIYCFTQMLLIVWFVPIDENHFYEARVPLQDTFSGTPDDSHDPRQPTSLDNS